MTRRSVGALLQCFGFLCAVVAGAADRGGTPEVGVASGVVVEEVARHSAAEKAGIQPGDVIQSWARPAAPPANRHPAQGTLESPFDLAEVEVEQAPRGPVTLAGWRGREGTTWTLAPVSLGLTVRPALAGLLLTRYQEGNDLVESKKVEDGVERWRVAATEAARQGDRVLYTWFLSKAGKVLADAGIRPETDAVYEEAIQEATSGARTGVAAALLRQWGDACRSRGDLDRAEDCYRRALELDEKLDSERVAIASDLHRLGVTAVDRGDLAGAEEWYQRALAISGKLAPGSHLLAANLNSLGIAKTIRGEQATAADYYQRSLAIREELDPGGLLVAATLNNLGIVSGDPDTAEDYFRRALAIDEKLAPESRGVAISLANLAELALDRGDLEAAERLHRRALTLDEKLAPGSLGHAANLEGLGLVLKTRGDLAAAEEHVRRALAIKESLAPGSLYVATTLDILGDVAKDRGDLVSAVEHYRHALAIQEKLAPGTDVEAESLHALGLVLRQTAGVEAGSGFLSGALDALETQMTKLRGTQDTRSGFTARYAAYYHDSIEALLELRRPGEALHVLERSRARSLLALLAERDLLFSADLPPDLARERRLADGEYDRIQAQIAKLNPARDGAVIDTLLGRLRQLREKQEEIGARIRTASPRLASLQYPRPLDLAGVRSALDPGTLFLAYSVGRERTVLFAVEASGLPGSGLFVFSLPVGEKALRDQVEAFRRAIQQPVRIGSEALTAQAAELYDLLIRPAESQVAASERLLVSPDGPLHSLPFGALVRKEAHRPKAAASYLIEWKPLHVAVSATVYAELKKSRREAAAPGRLVAFGDPRYPPLSKAQADRSGNPEVRSAIARGLSLTPLPFTREEVEDIAGLFPDRTRKYLGEEATEEHAKSIGPDVRYVHFACHGSLDERFPLNSALALSIPERPAEGQDNGLLQAWEIFDRVRIGADLVTLSACKTGLGKEMGGEGLLGLTRAFHYAGARSVLATLWAVSDRSTPLLMKRFYAYLKAGQSQDEALRAAQIDLIRTAASGKDRAAEDLSHPFRWAGFQLSGDWR